MEQLDKHYFLILRYGLLRARDASYEPTTDKVRAETEHLHEIPSLIGDDNLLRHYDYLRRMRTAYLSWYEQHRPDELAGVQALFGPAWRRMADEVIRAKKAQDAAGGDESGESSA